jgi:hypothetical protein
MAGSVISGVKPPGSKARNFIGWFVFVVHYCLYAEPDKE